MSSAVIEVALGERSYPIHVGANLLGHTDVWREAIRGRQVLIVSNNVVAPLYLQRVLVGLEGIKTASLVIEDGERFKTLATVGRVFEALAELGASRDACVIALGGGVIGDLAGFAAACWMRGIDVVQMPTSLLAMVDASVGGKTAVNLEAGKNLVGAFHQPQAVVIDTDTLATLPDREYRSGLAEVVKYGAIGDAGFLDRMDAISDAILARDNDALAEIIAYCCRCKADIVASDEIEQGNRALLNFGHSFAHALETATGYGSLLHGEAVAIGMVLAARLSAEIGMAAADDAARLGRLLERFGLPTTVPEGIEVDALLRHMQLDKKNRSGRLRLILWRGVGTAEIVDDVSPERVRTVLG